MNPLYVSDLDGTLLRSDESLSPFTAETIQGLIEKGMLFSYATARSFVTASKVAKSAKERDHPPHLITKLFLIAQIGQLTSAALFIYITSMCPVHVIVTFLMNTLLNYLSFNHRLIFINCSNAQWNNSQIKQQYVCFILPQISL